MISITKLKKIFEDVQLIRNSVSKSHEKYVVAGLESLTIELLLKSGESLFFVSSRVHPTDMINLCDSIKVSLKLMINEPQKELDKFMLMDMLTTVIKVKFIINEQI